MPHKTPAARREYQRAYAVAHRAKRLAARAIWLAKNRDRMRAYHADWRAQNRDKVRAYALKSYASNKDKKNASARARRAKDPEKHRAWYRRHTLMKEYGLTPEAYGVMLGKQEGRCAICAVVLGGNAPVDHCHKSGATRGLLCNNCNLILGLAHEAPRIFDKASQYLAIHAQMAECP